MSEKFLKLLMVSGAPNKELRFREQLGRIPDTVLEDLGIAGIMLRRLDCPVVERNHEPRTPILYDAKASDTHKLMKNELLEDEVGLTVDIHPKVGVPGKSFDAALTKYPGYLALSTRSEREMAGIKLLVDYFGKYEKDSELLVRIGAGVCPWVFRQGLLGIVSENDYIQYEKNILPDEVAAKDFLDFTAETHKGVDGDLDNHNLERSARSPGFMLHESALEWAVRVRHIGVETKTRCESPIEAIGQLVDGFTTEMVNEVIRIAGSYILFTQSPSKRAETRVKLLPERVDKVIWSHDEQRLVAEYVGPYKY